MRRIALFSDVHGNALALDVVLADIGRNGINDVYCLGDLVGYGPDPSGVIRRIRASGIPTIRGNYDDGVGKRTSDCGCYYATEQAKSDGAASYAFTDQALDDDEHAWLATLPDELRLTVDDAKVLLAHGSPRKINEYLLPDRADAQLARLATQADADVVCVGHVHIPYHRTMTGTGDRHIHYVSSGSVGKPKDGDPRAAWAEVILGTKAQVVLRAADDEAVAPAGETLTHVGVVFHRVEYDVDAVAAMVIEAGLPPTLAAALVKA